MTWKPRVHVDNWTEVYARSYPGCCLDGFVTHKEKSLKRRKRPVVYHTVVRGAYMRPEEFEAFLERTRKTTQVSAVRRGGKLLTLDKVD